MTYLCTLYGDLIWIETTGSPASFNKSPLDNRFCGLCHILISY